MQFLEKEKCDKGKRDLVIIVQWERNVSMRI